MLSVRPNVAKRESLQFIGVTHCYPPLPFGMEFWLLTSSTTHHPGMSGRGWLMVAVGELPSVPFVSMGRLTQPLLWWPVPCRTVNLVD